MPNLLADGGSTVALPHRCHLNVPHSSSDAKTAKDAAGRADWKVNTSGMDGCHWP